MRGEVVSRAIIERLPLNVEFAASCLDGALEDEPLEIRKWWATIRCYLAGLTAEPPQASPATPTPSEKGEK